MLIWFLICIVVVLNLIIDFIVWVMLNVEELKLVLMFISSGRL